jgi:hypothetical protein
MYTFLIMTTIFAWVKAYGKNRKSKRPAIGPLQPARVSINQASQRIAEVKPNEVVHRQKARVASRSEVRSQPTQISKSVYRSGGHVGGKTNRTKTQPTVVTNSTVLPMGGTYLEGPQSNMVISHQEYDAESPPPPISLTYTLGETGSSKRLDQYKKMYKGSTYELDTYTLKVGGYGTSGLQKFRPSTMAGFGRANIVWPYWLHDHYASASNQLTSKTSCFNRSQIEDVFKKMWDAVGIGDVQLDTAIERLEDAKGGDQRIDFALDYIECEYKYFNNNTVLPIDLSLYICTPNRNMTASHSPMSDWFNPASAGKTPLLMLPDYFYEPILVADENVMFNTGTDTHGVTIPTNISVRTSKDSILTASTEVVPEATPQGFSEKFRRNWNVRHVQPVVLMPQQELVLTFRVKMTNMFDFKRYLSYDASSDKFQSFEDMTLFPMVKFQGRDTTAVSSNLNRENNDGGVITRGALNRFLATTAPRSGPSMLSTSMKTRARVHTKTAPIRDFSDEYTYNVGDILDVFSVSKRDLFKYNHVERGQQAPYYQVNDNLGYFDNTDTKPQSNKYLTSLVELNLKQFGSELPSNGEPLATQLKLVDTASNWGVIKAKSNARSILKDIGSDVGKED